MKLISQISAPFTYTGTRKSRTAEFLDIVMRVETIFLTKCRIASVAITPPWCLDADACRQAL